jgi:hypothetical protein
MKASNEDAMAEIERMMNDIRNDIPGHPSAEECDFDECVVCAMRDCPYGYIEHYWKDGCPGCDLPIRTAK